MVTIQTIQSHARIVQHLESRVRTAISNCALPAWNLPTDSRQNPHRTAEQGIGHTARMPSIAKLSPFLWFESQAEAAVDHYTSVFPNSSIDHVARYGSAGPGPVGEVMAIDFTIFSQPMIALNGNTDQPFTYAISLMISCDSQEEVDLYWDRLLEGGKSLACGWVTDKFGITWQITPRVLNELLRNGDDDSVQRVMGAMMQMIKLDFATLEAAAKG